MQWDDGGDYTKGMVWRLFVAKLLNLMIQVSTHRGWGGGRRGWGDGEGGGEGAANGKTL